MGLLTNLPILTSFFFSTLVSLVIQEFPVVARRVSSLLVQALMPVESIVVWYDWSVQSANNNRKFPPKVRCPFKVVSPTKVKLSRYNSTRCHQYVGFDRLGDVLSRVPSSVLISV